MLEGAIPAALLALAVEALFDLAERMIARRTFYGGDDHGYTDYSTLDEQGWPGKVP